MVFSISLSLKIFRQSLLNNNISTVQIMNAESCSAGNKKIAALKKTFEDCEGMYEAYKDIADTYYSIVKGDYVSTLITEKRKFPKH